VQGLWKGTVAAELEAGSEGLDRFMDASTSWRFQVHFAISTWDEDPD
jgi:hypothetical protein